MDPLVVAALATGFFVFLSWVAWLVFVDRQLSRGHTVKAVTDVPKAFWRWLRWKP